MWFQFDLFLFVSFIPFLFLFFVRKWVSVEWDDRLLLLCGRSAELTCLCSGWFPPGRERRGYSPFKLFYIHTFTVCLISIPHIFICV